MTTPTESKQDISSADDDADARAARRRADAEARRAIEEANRLAREREEAYQARLAERLAIEQAEAEEKLAAARAQAEAKAQAARAKAQAKAEAARIKAEAKAAAAVEKAQARAAAIAAKEAKAAEKQAENAGRNEEKAQLQALKRRLRDETRAQTKELGAPLGDLLGWFLQVLAQRADIVVLSEDPPSPMELEALLEHAELGAEVLAFYNRLGALRFCFGFEKEGPAIGAVQVPELSGLYWIPAANESTTTQVALSADGERAESLRLLLEPRARRAFIDGGASADWERLQNSSASRWSTPTCLVEAIISKGFSETQAKSLVSWLGQDARLLLHRLETSEGRRRDELLKKVDGSDGTLNRWLLEAMNAGPALEKSQWQKILADHQSFLERGGGGGTFEFQVQDGLPSLVYHGPAVPGQALLSCENLSGAKFEGADLAYAGFAGVRGDQTSFAKADLSHASLTYAVLEGAKFNGAKLVKCDLTACKLVGANFRGADLTGSNFERANLTGANFAGAITNGTRFGGALIKDVKY